MHRETKLTTMSKSMEKSDDYKIIDGIIYKPSWADTFKRLAVGEEMRLNRNQLTYHVARSTTRWITMRYTGYKFSITALDHFKDNFIVKRISA
jgi:hypothetical protein